jgi:hypothetical protein
MTLPPLWVAKKEKKAADGPAGSATFIEHLSNFPQD